MKLSMKEERQERKSSSFVGRKSMELHPFHHFYKLLTLLQLTKSLILLISCVQKKEIISLIVCPWLLKLLLENLKEVQKNLAGIIF